jgi:hypothetical protein
MFLHLRAFGAFFVIVVDSVLGHGSSPYSIIYPAIYVFFFWQIGFFNPSSERKVAPG